jgi:electron transfer flavoprotein beta subunit
MNIIVPIKIVPDLVEELKIDAQASGFDQDLLRFNLNEFDDHALEQAILLKERGGGSVTVIAIDGKGVEDILITASARGADRVIKLTTDSANDTSGFVNNHALAYMLVPLTQELEPDLILTGVYANNDLDGPLGPLLAERLGYPYLGYVVGVAVRNGSALIRKEFSGGLLAEMEVRLPAVLGIQAAEQPPRYVAFNKKRQAIKTTVIEERAEQDFLHITGPVIDRLYPPEKTRKAEMISGNVDAVAARLVGIFTELGVI